MEFGQEKYTIRIKKSEKRHMTDGKELLNQEKKRTLGEKATYKYLGLLEVHTIKQMGMKDKIKKA